MRADVSRRSFLGAAGAVGALAATGVEHRAAAPPVENAPAWVDRPMRWAQLTLVEDDPGQFDLAVLARLLPAAPTATRVCLSAGGCVAYYPTKVPFHHRSAWLGDRDPFGDLVAGCRKLGMVVIARTDPHATYDDVHAAHPDWIAVDAEGQPRRHWASPEMWVTCALGPYNFEFMTEVHQRDHDPLPGRRHLHQPLGRLRHVLLRALPEELPGGDRARPAAHRRPAGPGAARLHPLAAATPLRAVAALGRRGPQDQSRLLRDPQHRRRRDQLARHEDASASWPPRSSPTARRAAG